MEVLAPLFAWAERSRCLRPPKTIAQRFARFHAANPHVYELFARFAAEVRAAGHNRFSADAILHRIRWYCGVETKNMDFKINNDFSAYYSRLLVSNDPSFDGFFETRRIRNTEGR